jgi:hypothetical protein
MRSLSWLCICACVLVLGCGDDDGGSGPNTDHDASVVITAEECFADLTAPTDGWFVETQRFATADDAIELWRARKPGMRSAVGETFPYDLVRFWIGSDDEPGTCVTAPSAMTYDFAHHNWDETWSAITEHGRYVVHERLEFGDAATSWQDTLDVFDLNDVPRGGTQTLEATGCASLPYDLNPCLFRTRIDMPPPGWGEE